MNFKLIFALSLFGLAMAVATVYVIPFKQEWMYWLPIFLICAFIIAKIAPGKYFLHGFTTSLFNCAWILAVHLILYSTYMSVHKEEAETMMKDMPLPTHPRIMMILMGSAIGIASGIVLGLFSLLASKIFKK